MARKRKVWGQTPSSEASETQSRAKRVTLNPGIRTKQPLTPEEQERVLAVAKGMGDFEYRTILIFLDTGMHPCVLAGDCEGSDPHLEIWNGEVIRWIRPKNNEKVELLIPKRLKPFIDDYLKAERPRYRKWYNRLIEEIGRKAGLPGLSPLSFRHTFAVNRLDQGYSLSDLKKMMGTKSTRALEHYLGLSVEHMKKRIQGREW